MPNLLGWRKLIVVIAVLVPAYFIPLTEGQASLIETVALGYLLTNAGKAVGGDLVQKIGEMAAARSRSRAGDPGAAEPQE